MSRLIPGCYGTEFNAIEGPFGLKCGQIRTGRIAHNAGWYNRKGEKLGFGDLLPENLERIKNELQDGECFLILTENDSFWNFVKQRGLSGSTSVVDPKEMNPGIDYVTEKARFAIFPGAIYQPGENLKLTDLRKMVANEPEKS